MDHCQLIVFGRYPTVGMTKTRLIPALGPAGAAALSKGLTETTVVAARQTTERIGARLMFCHDGGSEEQLRCWLGCGPIRYLPQANGDLGRRMYLAVQHAFRAGARKVVLVGTDIPGVTPAVLEEAFDALGRHDVVLGPSTDGGYWLVGMRTPANIFDGIAWSTPAVCQQTLALARQKKMTSSLLKPLSDVDTPEDLLREMGVQKSGAPYLSVVIPATNAQRQIAATVGAALSPDAEVIVVDGGSTDLTQTIARSHGARIVSGSCGRARQKNRGAAAARGQVLLFIPAHIRLPDNFVDTIFETLMNRHTILGAFRLETSGLSPLVGKIAWLINHRAERMGLPSGHQGVFMHKGDFDAVGGFPELPMVDTRALVQRMTRHGGIAFSRSAAVTVAECGVHPGTMRAIISDVFTCLTGMGRVRSAPLSRRQRRTTRP